MKRFKCNRNIYCQFLIASQKNFTATQLEQLTSISHDSATRWLSSTKLTPKILWEKVEPIIYKEGGVLIVDDSVISKQYSRSNNLELLSYQYSGAYHKVIKGIGLVNLVLTNQSDDSIIPIDYRVYSKKVDGKSKHNHFQDMVTLAQHRGINPAVVAFDGWYASVKNLKFLERSDLKWVTVLAPNRIVDYGEHLSDKDISSEGLIVHLKAYGFIKVFKTFSQAKGEVEYLATNNLDYTLKDIKTVAAQRWKIEEYHRGLKQTTGIERCQFRNQRAQRNHIFCAILTYLAFEVNRIKKQTSWYLMKQSIIQDAMRQYLKNPTISFNFG